MTNEELMVEARLAIPTTFVVIYDSLMSLLKAHEKHVKNGETLIHTTQMDNGKYRVRYEVKTAEVTRRAKEVYKEYLLNPPKIQP